MTGAVAAGELQRERFAAWQRAERDREVFERRQDPVATSAETRRKRSLNRSLRQARKKHWI